MEENTHAAWVLQYARLAANGQALLVTLACAWVVALVRGQAAKGNQCRGEVRRPSVDATERECLLQVAGRPVVLALACGDAPGAVQRHAAEYRSGVVAVRESRVQPASALGEVSTRFPERAERAGKREAAIGLVRIQRPLQGGAEVRVVVLEALQTGCLSRAGELRLGRLRP